MEQTEEKKEARRFRLTVPLDASGIEGFQPEKMVKVLIRHADGSTQEDVVKLDRNGKGSAAFQFTEKPGALQVFVGPGDAEENELLNLQTIQADLPASRWGRARELTYPVLIPAYYWHWWLTWCRTFTIRGRVICPDGKPVPNATVCAFDVDAWWWWFSTQQVGCAVTDATGAFEITFRWCCGWWPWWWWRHRFWRLEPRLVDRLQDIIKHLKLVYPPVPGPRPDPVIFDQLLEAANPLPGPLPPPPTAMSQPAAIERKAPGKELKTASIKMDTQFKVGNLHLAELEDTRVKLKDLLAPQPELEHLHLWPWYPWAPWWDCTPDIIFKVTQPCEGTQNVILQESWWDARWNIPNPLNVTLVANDLACCIDPTPQPEGNCINLTHVCNAPVSTIGGNLSAPPSPVGFYNPGAISTGGDRPFAERATIRGDFGTLAGADYYEFEWYDTSAAAWKPMPAGAMLGFNRLFYGPQLPAGPIGTYPVPFHVTPIDGHLVTESRQHFQANNDPGSWETLAPGSRWWMDHKDLLAVWDTTTFPDGTYPLRVVAWQFAGGHLTNPQILPQCGSQPPVDNALVITIDNRIVGSGSGHPPSTSTHPCGPSTVHYCTLEPDTAFVEVKIVHADTTETPVSACGTIPILPTDDLVVDFIAYDKDAHLSYYTLVATYGDNQISYLLSLPHTLTPIAAPPVPAAVQVGPTYAHARSANLPPYGGAVAPIWSGGGIRLRMKAADAFPISCCYQLELRAHKRTIVNCSYSLWGHTNLSERSFMIVV